MWAIGGAFGVGAPSDSSLDKGPTIAGTLDGYLTPRVSVRGQLGGGWFDIVGRHVTGTQDATDTAFGVNVGGGIEYFLNRRTTFLGEALYHHVGEVNTPLATFTGPFWAVSAGLKRYF